MVQISNDDARAIQSLLERAARFYGEHAVHTRDQDTGRLIKKMSKKMSKYCALTTRTIKIQTPI